MYAIRSYYVLSLGCLISGIGIALLPHSPNFPWLITIVTFLGIGTAAFHPEGFKATACITSVKRATGMSVITSYSIHYTKLYDHPCGKGSLHRYPPSREDTGGAEARQRALVHRRRRNLGGGTVEGGC